MSEMVNGLTFDNWMDKVNRIVAATIGLGTGDIADACYWDMWNDGMKPGAAAVEAIRNDDTFGMLLDGGF